jgi:hypothetical protein
MIVGIGRQNIIILFRKKGGCTVSFQGIHKWEPDIHTGFSPGPSFAVVHTRTPIIFYYGRIPIENIPESVIFLTYLHRYQDREDNSCFFNNE